MNNNIAFSELVEINPKVRLIKNQSYPFVDMSVVDPSRRYVTASELRSFGNGGAKFKGNDILFARITPCLENGKIAQYHASEASIGFGSTEFFVFRNRKGISDAGYVYYLSRSEIVRKPAEKSMYGASGRQRADIKSIMNLSVPAPPLPTQRKIAAILSAYDELIENNTRRIKILEEMAQAIYREWFVNFRFPGHEKVKMVDSPMGKIPQGWDLVNLGNIVDTQYGYTASTTTDPIGPQYLRGMDINKNTFIDWASVPYCPIDTENINKYSLNKGDILIIRMADPGKVGIVEKDVNAVFASYLIRIKPTDPRLTTYYLFHFLISDAYQGYVSGSSTGTTRKSASAGVLTNINFILPPFSVTEIFEAKISVLRSLINNLLESNKTLRQTRDLLLPRLISGEIDVSDLDISIPEEVT